jgi:CheY-like chemotaxis protein
MQVLLVDDEEELVTALAERLSLRGIEALWATSAEEALRVLETRSFDLAVLDVKIPKIDGLQLKKRMQAMRPGMKFIFVTGHAPRFPDRRRGRCRLLSREAAENRRFDRQDERGAGKLKEACSEHPGGSDRSRRN